MRFRNFSIILLLCSSVTSMTSALIAPALPSMAQSFSDAGVDNAEILAKLFLSVHPLFLGIFAPICGILVDQWGRKKVLLLSLAIFSLAGFVPYVLNSLYIILISRAILGIGLGGITVSVTALIGDNFSKENLSRFSGYQAGAIAASSAAFYILGGVLASFSWRIPFLLYLSPVILIIPVLFIQRFAKLHSENAQDCIEDTKVNHFALYTLYLLTFIGMIFSFTYAVQFPFFLKEIDVDEKMIGIANAAMVIFSFFTAITYGRTKNYLSFIQIFSLFFVISGFGFIVISFSTNVIMAMFGSCLFGIGYGLFLPNANVWLNSVVSSKIRGRYAGFLTASLLLGQLCAPLISQVTIELFDYKVLFLVFGVLAILNAMGMLVLSQRLKQSD